MYLDTQIMTMHLFIIWEKVHISLGFPKTFSYHNILIQSVLLLWNVKASLCARSSQLSIEIQALTMKHVKVKIYQLRETVAENLIIQQNKTKKTHTFSI